MSVAEGSFLPGGAWREFGSVQTARGYVSGLGAWVPAVFALVHAAQVVAAPVPGGVTTVAGPLLFGPWLGTVLIVAGGVAGSVVLFALVRRWGRPLAARIVGRASLERFSGAFDDGGGAVLVVVMLVPFVPDDVAVAAAGLLGISLKRFVLLLVLGRLPGWLLMAFVAAELVGRSAATLVAVGLSVAVAAILVLAYRGRLERWLLRRDRRP